jgi:hypothetical protein
MNLKTSSFSIDIATMSNPRLIVDLGVNDNDQAVEEPDEAKVSSPVLKTSGAGDSLAEFNL